jgi:hypothetical protein
VQRVPVKPSALVLGHGDFGHTATQIANNDFGFFWLE